jgi:hypothetical protein
MGGFMRRWSEVSKVCICVLGVGLGWDQGYGQEG